MLHDEEAAAAAPSDSIENAGAGGKL